MATSGADMLDELDSVGEQEAARLTGSDLDLLGQVEVFDWFRDGTAMFEVGWVG